MINEAHKRGARSAILPSKLNTVMKSSLGKLIHEKMLDDIVVPFDSKGSIDMGCDPGPIRLRRCEGRLLIALAQ